MAPFVSIVVEGECRAERLKVKCLLGKKDRSV